MAKKTIMGKSPLAGMFRTSPLKKKPAEQVSAPPPIEANVPSRAAPRIEAASRAQGLSATGVRGQIGDPADISGPQRIAIAVKKAGFEGDFVKKFIDQARKELIAANVDDPTSPDYKNKSFVPSPGDIKAQAYDIAMRKVSNVREPKLQAILEKTARTAFGLDTTEPRRLQKGVTKADKPRKGLTGEGQQDLDEGMRNKLSAAMRERRPDLIVAEGISDDVLRNDIVKMQDAIKNKDEAAYAKHLRRFEQRFATLMVQEKQISVSDTDRTSNRDAAGPSRESQGRKEIYQESGPQKPGSETEGKVAVKGTIKREPMDISKDALDVIAADEDQLNKFLSRFSETDQIALRKKFERIKDDPGSEAAQMARGDLLRTMTKALSIEGISKNLAITDEGKGAKQRRALSGVAPSPVVELERREQQAANKGRVAAAIQAINGIRVGYGKLPVNEQRRRMTGDIGSIMEAFRGYTQNRMLLRSIEGGVRNAAGKAAAGNLDPINKIGSIIRSISRVGNVPTAEKQIAGRQGDMSQIEAMLTGIGTRVRGGPSARRAQAGRNVLTGKEEPPVLGIPESSPMRRTDVRGDEPRRTIGEPYVAPPVQKEVAKRKPVRPVAQSALADAIDEYMADIQAEAGGAGDVQYGGGRGQPSLESMQRSRRLLTERIKRLTLDSKNELEKLRKTRVPAAIRDVNQLESAKAQLAKLERERKDLDAEYRRIPQLLEVFAKDPAPGQGYEGEYKDGGREFRSSETSGGLFSRKQTVGEFKEQLQNRIKLLERQVADYQRVIAKAAKAGKIKGRDVGVALREGERGEMQPKRMDISRMRRQLARTTDPKERRRIEKLLGRAGVLFGPALKQGPKQKSAAVSAEPLPEMFAPSRVPAERDIREVTAGEFTDGEQEVRGRKISPQRRRGKRTKYKPKRPEGDRTSDLRAIYGPTGNRELAALIEGLPR
jgi:hypothetical protein